MYPINHNGPHRTTFCLCVCKCLCFDQMSVKQLLSLFGVTSASSDGAVHQQMFPTIRPKDLITVIRNKTYTYLYVTNPMYTLAYCAVKGEKFQDNLPFLTMVCRINLMIES